MNKNDEIILAAPVRTIFNNGSLKFQGVESDPEKVAAIADRLAGSVISGRRGNFEENTRFKQPIPYVILKKGDEVFMYSRIGGGEERLKGKGSIGIGGHMNPVPGNHSFINTINVNLQRELEEEINLEGSISELKIVGFINDDTNDVGKVHIGILAIAELSEDSVVSVKETDVLEGEMIKISKLKQKRTNENLENWSKIASMIL